MCTLSHWMAQIHKKRSENESIAESGLTGAADCLGRTEHICVTVIG